MGPFCPFSLSSSCYLAAFCPSFLNADCGCVTIPSSGLLPPQTSFEPKRNLV